MREFEDELPMFRGDALGHARREARYRRQWYAQPPRARLDGLVLTIWIIVAVMDIVCWGALIWTIILFVRWVVSHG